MTNHLTGDDQGRAPAPAGQPAPRKQHRVRNTRLLLLGLAVVIWVIIGVILSHISI